MNCSKILIVEDEAIIATDLQNKFRYWGYSATKIASSQEEALEIANKIKPDLTLIDIKIKKENGIKLAKEITDNYDTAVVYITGHFDEEMVQLMRATRPYGYISMPFEENQLKFKVEDAMYRHKIHQRFILSK
ncbi:MAG: response regulator [Methanobacterium sp.]